jgi:hypothetical protein
MVDTVTKHFGVRTRKGFTGATGRQQGATLIMVNSQAIVCTKDVYKEGRDLQVVNFCVIAVHSEGMVRAPFKYNDQRKGAAKVVSKPLTAMTADGGMQFWTYQRKGQDKGDRLDDDTWVLKPGTTLKHFFRAEDVDKGVFGTLEYIPALSMCEVQFVPKSSEPCSEGWGLNVRSVSLTPLSLYSYFEHLRDMPSSVEDAKLFAISVASSEKQMHRQIDSDQALFVQSPVSCDAYTEYVSAADVEGATEGFVRLWNFIPGNPACLDIFESRLLAMTNSSNVENASRLLEVAVSVGCVSVVCFSNEYRGKRKGVSNFCGVPVINTDKLLGFAGGEGSSVRGVSGACFLMQQKAPFSADSEEMYLCVGEEVRSGSCAAVQQCNDLILCETAEQCGEGVAISFVLGDGTVLWRGVMNVSPVQMLCAGVSVLPQRRKWTSM